MITVRSKEYLKGILKELLMLPREAEWVDFKHNNSDPEAMGEYISALSNSAALLGKLSAFMVWGIDDKTHDIVGTNFKPFSQRKDQEELENWLLRYLTPRINFSFNELEIDGKNIVILEIDSAKRHPVQFHGIEFIRIGSYKKKLKDYQEKERELWRIFDRIPHWCPIISRTVSVG